jgi:hydrogenase maturation protein HypF
LAAGYARHSSASGGNLPEGRPEQAQGRTLELDESLELRTVKELVMTASDETGSCDDIRRLRLLVRGQVQGVGFRPFVFRLAEQRALTGFVRNGPDGVCIEVQGKADALHTFTVALQEELPPLAGIAGMESETLPPEPRETAFAIKASGEGRGRSVLVSPDVGICPQCLAEIRDGANRRFRHPFANCTDCGPRYSITRRIPYDRSGTSMACFSLCPECRAEYDNPRDRRFHAQPNACPRCGPELRLELPGGAGESIRIDGPGALPALARFLLDGGIAAVKGIGGFHLACDARNDRAIAELRRRKRRPHQALAVMAASLDDVRRITASGPEEEDALLSPERPIVVCPLPAPAKNASGRHPARPDDLCGKRGPPVVFQETSTPAPAGIAPVVSSLVSPDTRSIGVMLPYSPLHVVLMDEFSALARREGRTGPAALVMTSGNRRGEPICLGNREARIALAGIADAFLFHNRDILVRVDDSVVRPRPAWDRDGPGLIFFRRARGFVPRPIGFAASVTAHGEMCPPQVPACTGGIPPPCKVTARRETSPTQVGRRRSGQSPEASPDPGGASPCVFGAGADLKNALCLTRGTQAFVGQHAGDMEDPGAAAFHETVRDHLMRLLHVEPEIVVRDTHPDSLSGRIAEEYAGRFGLPVLRLQHHFAHAHAVLAENGHAGKALVLVLDGSGFGSDGTLWGGEFLFLDPCPAGGGPPVHKRTARMAPLDLPGGDAATREPWRIAHALLLRLGLIGGRGTALFPLPWLPEKSFAADMLPFMLERGLNTPRGSGCGRLFDAVSALLGLCSEASYEGQAALRLEEAQGSHPLSSEAFFSDSFLYPCPLLPDPDSECSLDAEPDSPHGGDAGSAADRKSASGSRQGGKGLFFLDTRALFRALCEDLASGSPPALIARRFHRSLAAGLVEAASFLATAYGLTTVGLSGGCMQNMTLSGLLRRGLEKKGLSTQEHVLLPPGDGCIGFGQAVYGYLMSRCSRISFNPQREVSDSNHLE